MGASEIVLPFTEPETEWVRGRALQKVHDSAGAAVLGSGATLTHPALPAFALSLAELFATIAPPR